VYKDANGLYSYTAPTQGNVDSSPFDPTDVPDGTDFAGSYHTHGGYVPGQASEMFSFPRDQILNDIGNYMLPSNNGQPGFLGTPGGRVEVFYPSQASTQIFGCALIGPPIPGAFGGGVPSCH
jgi:hypothetical protein